MTRSWIEDKELAALAAARTDFPTFLEFCFSVIYPGEKFIRNRYIRAISWRLMLAANGEFPKQIYNLPPRNLKSFIITVAFTAWYIGQNPSARVILCSYSSELTSKYLRDIRMIIEEPWYQAIFPDMRISQRKNSETEIATTMKGSIFTTSTGGTLTGRGGNLIILDDPMNAADIGSEAARKRVKEWFDTTLYSRQDDKEKTILLVVMQRLHEDDLTGHLIEKGTFQVFAFPAINDTTRKIRTSDSTYYIWHHGQVLNPGREDRASLEETKSTIGSYNFSAQYLQAPVPAQGNLFRRKWLKDFTKIPANEKSTVLISWDVADSLNEAADYSVGTFWVLMSEGCYLLDVIRVKRRFTDLLDIVADSARKYRNSITLVENAGTGRALIDALRQYHPDIICKHYNPREDKQTRAIRHSVHFENGWVYLKKNAPWRADLEKELLTFPNGKHDDQVDSITQALFYAELFYRPGHRRLNCNVYSLGASRDENN